LRGFLDALGKDGRNGLALDYAKTFSKKGWVDEVDGRLLEARVQSAWKGHGKDAEIAYEAVITEHPEDFRGYLAQGVFFRTVGKPDAAEDAFRKAKSLAPSDTASVVNQVIAASKASKR
jgi:Tfp pilus assembly protein PilF